MTPEEWQELLSDPGNWPDESAAEWSAQWKLFYWAAKEIHTDSANLYREIDEKGLNELYLEVLAKLGYDVAETSSGKEINLARNEQMHSLRRIARFLLEADNTGKSSETISSELRELGYQA